MKAQEGVVALRDLHRKANATVYGTAVVRLEMERGLVIVQPTDHGPIPLGVGAIVKGLVEFFQTPAGGTHASEGSEAPPGESWRDYLRTEVMSDDSLADLARAIHPGNFAVIAEVSDDCAAPIDTRMIALGGNVMRVQREDFTADVITKGTAALMEDVHEWRADHAAIKARAMEKKPRESDRRSALETPAHRGRRSAASSGRAGGSGRRAEGAPRGGRLGNARCSEPHRAAAWGAPARPPRARFDAGTRVRAHARAASRTTGCQGK